MDPTALTLELKQEARRLGFSLTGVCPAVSPGGFARIGEWLERGYGGQMHYIADRLHAYEHPRHVLDGVRSIVMLGMNYRTADPAEPATGQGAIARYAWGSRDYHDVLHERLKQLATFLQAMVPLASARGVVDTAPLLEREFAQLAGLGWIGKNTLLLNKEQGSWFFLAALLTDQELDYDDPHNADHCGTCRACLDACPTDAFPQPYLLDASRCISYLTIELRDAIPVGLREGIGDWLFGCDICQEVCPWNRRTPLSEEPAFAPIERLHAAELTQLFALSDADFRQLFRHSPLWRPRRRGLLRNAAIVLGNRRHAGALPALRRGLEDEEPLVRSACAWALGRYDDAAGRAALENRLVCETDASTRLELLDALQQAQGPAAAQERAEHEARSASRSSGLC